MAKERMLRGCAKQSGMLRETPTRQQPARLSISDEWKEFNMRTKYWNLNTRIKCPNCGKNSMWNLQTHFMGDFGSCLNEYKLNEKVKELGNISVTLDGKNDDFIGSCDYCDKYYDFGADIKESRVEKVYLLQNQD